MRIDEKTLRILDEKLSRAISGIEEILDSLLEKDNLNTEDIKRLVEPLQPSFSVLSKKHVLEILYILLITGPLSFTDLKKTLRINQSSLALKLRELEKMGFLERKLIRHKSRPQVMYFLTETGRKTALLSIPLIYYIASKEIKPVNELRKE